MSCKNAFLLRFRVRIEGTRYGFLPLPKILKVTGMSLGDYETELVEEQNKIVQVTTNTRKIAPLGITGLFAGDGLHADAFFLLKEWHDNSRKITRTIFVDVTTRTWQPLLTWVFFKCSISDFVWDDMEIGTNLGKYTAKFEPYDVIVENSLKVGTTDTSKLIRT